MLTGGVDFRFHPTEDEMRFLVVVALCLPLQGCFFFLYIPGSVIDKMRAGNACATEGSVVGQNLKHTDGRLGVIEKIYGPSDRCRESVYPVLVDVKFN